PFESPYRTTPRKMPSAKSPSPTSSGWWWPRGPLRFTRFIFLTRAGVFGRSLVERRFRAMAATSPGRERFLLAESRDPLLEQVEEALGVDADGDLRVRLVPGAPIEIDDRSTACQVRLRLDRHVTLGELEQVRPDHVCDGHRVVDGRAVPSVRLAMEDRVEVE